MCLSICKHTFPDFMKMRKIISEYIKSDSPQWFHFDAFSCEDA